MEIPVTVAGAPSKIPVKTSTFKWLPVGNTN